MHFFARNSSRSATARAAPSSGAVPVPTSSTRTSVCGVASSSIDFRLSMCAEKVERSAAIDCSSPMSTRTRSKIGSTGALRGDGNRGLRGKSGDAGGFERDGFAAGVGAADDEEALFAAEIGATWERSGDFRGGVCFRGRDDVRRRGGVRSNRKIRAWWRRNPERSARGRRRYRARRSFRRRQRAGCAWIEGAR